MSSHYVEQRSLSGNASLSWDIAHHLYTRQLKGKAIIIAEDPAVLLSSIRKQWLKLTRRAQRERASTLDGERISELTQQIAHMQNMKFTAGDPLDQPQADVFIISPDQLTDLLPYSHTLYATCRVSEHLMQPLVSVQPIRSLIVVYN